MKVVKPWGFYEVLGKGKNYLVKKLVVKPGHRLSLQVHKLRSEYWVVVQGKAKVILGEDVKFLNEGDYIYVPRAVQHRLENPNPTDLVVIEIQFGICREDDIIRLIDDYGRNTTSYPRKA